MFVKAILSTCFGKTPGLTDTIFILTGLITAPNDHQRTAQCTPTKMESRTIDVQLQACRGPRACHSPTMAKEGDVSRR